MPQIRTYERQVSTPSGEVRSSASPETAGAIGQGIAKVGAALSGLEDTIHKNNVTKEVNETHVQLSKIRNDYTLRIQDETQKGTIDTQKIQQDYQEEVNKITGFASTGAGKSYFEKHSATLGFDLTRSAALAQAQVAGKKAVEQWQKSIDFNGNTLQKSPADFQDVLSSSLSAIDEQVSSGSLDSTDAEKLKRLTENEYAQQAVVGWANISPDTAKDLLEKGQFDKYLSGDQKSKLFSTIKTYKTAEGTEIERVKKLEEEKKKKISEAWEQGNLEKLHTNTISPKDILSSPLEANRKIQWLNMMEKNLKETVQTDPSVKNELIRRIMLPDNDPNKIVDPTQLYNHVGKGLTIPDITQMTKFLERTPEGKRLKDNRTLLLKQADATLVKRDPITGQPDPQGPYNMSLFTNALIDAEEKMRKEGKDASELYNPNSKDFFGNQILKYKATPQEIFQRQMNFQGFKAPDNVKEARLENESAEEYLKRVGK